MNVQIWAATAILVLGYIVGFYFQNRRLDDLRDTMNHRLDDLKDWLRAELRRIDEHLEGIRRPMSKP